MKRVWFPTLLLCLASLVLLGQKKDEDAIARAVRQLNQAMIDGNQIALEQLTTNQLSYDHSSGLIEDK